MRFHIVSLFPGAFDSYLKESIIARAIKAGLVKVDFYNLRDFGLGKHKKVDGRPYGGGPGMVLAPEPMLKAAASALKKIKSKKTKVLLMSPGGKQFDTAMAEKLSKYSDLILISGRYEGIDARVKKILKAEEISVGPYVLTGGELPALAVMDAVSRKLPGVLGNELSVEERRVSSSEVYTRPEVFEYKKKKYRVPKVLLSGNHAKMESWKNKTDNKRKLDSR
ncbi:MAG TPA: tRNA (guanosine(37)-N1)-methyltransferase TrmD [Candidatus Paceibacterota bacterium]|nr:tRNA (guanosine(37)-N1)-methyltransferase TrmD [Candidatus Paceibacterota bacterium]